MVRLPQYSLGIGRQSFANVSLATAEDNLQSVAIHATADLIASLTSELPIEIYSGSGPTRKLRSTPGYLLDPAGDGSGNEDWRYQLMMSWLLRGNLYAHQLATGQGGIPTQLLPWHPDTVRPQPAGDGTFKWYVLGKPIEDAEMFHRRINPVPGTLLGLSPIAQHASTIGLSLRTTRYGEQWFTDGAHPSSLLQNSESEINQTQADTVKARYLAVLYGTREPLVLGKGWTHSTIQVSPEESQFLATSGYTEAQCCRMFGPGFAEILGYDTGKSMTYTNVESRMIHVLVLSLSRWLTRMERLLSAMLPRPQVAVIDRDALLESTTLARFQAWQLALNSKWMTPNEVRGKEHLAPLDGGDDVITSPGPTAPADPGGNDAPAPDAS